MKLLDTKQLLTQYDSFKETTLFGRRITLEDIEPILKTISKKYPVKKIGSSEEERSIYTITIGSGAKRILIWTQMHGNESTGTKAIFDLLKFLEVDASGITETLLIECQLCIIPILNPDGAVAYTRVNANGIDLNRDAVQRTQKESTLLRTILEQFDPECCFNMHDQRTIFGVDGTKNPATLSFLAPSEEETRTITEGRKKTMNIIVAMNRALQQVIPLQIGRYTDEFYPNATGDNFQKLGYSTVLIESGHYKEDYQREEVRKFTMLSLLQGLYHIATAPNFSEYEPYFNIPNNVSSFYDLLHQYPNKPDEVYQYKEVLEKGQLKFIPEKITIKDISEYNFHNAIVFEG